MWFLCPVDVRENCWGNIAVHLLSDLHAHCVADLVTHVLFNLTVGCSGRCLCAAADWFRLDFALYLQVVWSCHTNPRASACCRWSGLLQILLG